MSNIPRFILVPNINDVEIPIQVDKIITVVPRQQHPGETSGAIIVMVDNKKEVTSASVGDVIKLLQRTSIVRARLVSEDNDDSVYSDDDSPKRAVRWKATTEDEALGPVGGED